jgi:mono/diheme cytochrome c family protein
MNKKLLSVSFIAFGASGYAIQQAGSGVGNFGAPLAKNEPAIDVREILVNPGVDPRLVGLPAGPGDVPKGSEMAILANKDSTFREGMEVFTRFFHKSQGVGAFEMNADSCSACHQDPVLGGAGALELNVSRFGDDGNGTLPFQNLPGGQGLSKLFPSFQPGREEYDPLTATVFEQRQTPSILGLGLLDMVPEQLILDNEDPFDLNGDGIYGYARMVDVNGIQEVGRFGWKAQVPRLRDFVMDAMGGELGITTPDDGRGFAMLADNDAVSDPELSLDEVNKIANFMTKLPPTPLKKPGHHPKVVAGAALFNSVGCATCHLPDLGGVHGFTNLLLHNVMPAGFRGMAEPGADVGFYRTPPLFGISDTAPYMHDGRAADLDAAILAHDGEAAGVRANFEALTATEQSNLLFFLKSL